MKPSVVLKGSLIERIIQQSTIKETELLHGNQLFSGNSDVTPTVIPVLNIALSGRIDGGLTSGLHMFAGPSKHFKTMFLLILMKSYLDAHKDGVALFYVSEFGSPVQYFESLKIDQSRVIVTPVTDIEQLRHDIVNQLNNIKRGDKVFIGVDSVGNLASKKEVDDALKGSEAADMTRAKVLKSFGRIVTPYLTLKDIPMVVVNHVYQTLEMFSKTIVSGGQGMYLSSSNIYIIGRQQDKDGKELTGYNFTITVEKSRYVIEKSKFDVTASFENGINRYTGLLDIAVDGGFVTKELVGKTYKYTSPDVQSSVFADQTGVKTFWDTVVKDPKFGQYVKDRYGISSHTLIEGA